MDSWGACASLYAAQVWHKYLKWLRALAAAHSVVGDAQACDGLTDDREEESSLPNVFGFQQLGFKEFLVIYTFPGSR